MSCRKAVLSAAACSKVSGGTSRVLVRPGTEALAMMAIPHEPSVLYRGFLPAPGCLTEVISVRSRFAACIRCYSESHGSIAGHEAQSPQISGPSLLHRDGSRE